MADDKLAKSLSAVLQREIKQALSTDDMVLVNQEIDMSKIRTTGRLTIGATQVSFYKINAGALVSMMTQERLDAAIAEAADDAQVRVIGAYSAAQFASDANSVLSNQDIVIANMIANKSISLTNIGQWVTIDILSQKIASQLSTADAAAVVETTPPTPAVDEDTGEWSATMVIMLVILFVMAAVLIYFLAYGIRLAISNRANSAR